MSPQPPAHCDQDYEAIEAAVMETARGRWFLNEFARRNRTADTRVVLEAMTRLEQSISDKISAPVALDYDRHVHEMSAAINQLYSDLALLQTSGTPLSITNDVKSLAALVGLEDIKTQRISSTLETLQEISWTMREIGVNVEFCDMLDCNTAEMSKLCGLDDVSATRINKLVSTIGNVQERLSLMAESLKRPAQDVEQNPALTFQQVENERAEKLEHPIEDIFLDEVQVMIPGAYHAQPSQDSTAVLTDEVLHVAPASSLPQLKEALSREWNEEKQDEAEEEVMTVSASCETYSNVTNLDFSSFSFEEKLALFS